MVGKGMQRRIEIGPGEPPVSVQVKVGKVR